ncbi:Tpt1/KptA family RNA 2'-phosphotransferase [Stachybotrys elegans]|uniref:2'-phosphotransferase n=1 Tax=Stachybotrys elegans TaxID=80388 RepID=A0A8K0T3F3_9HYPO|nr:Tpt1/KptA family RNA 2'-phosphotransferase [Stachybotrys elegans]
MSAGGEGGAAMSDHNDLTDKTYERHERGGGRRGGRGGRGGGRGAGQDRTVQVSRALSKLLRHQAEMVGISLDDGGFARLDKVLAHGPIRSMKVTFDDVQSVVAENDKQRFSMKPNPETNASGSLDTKEPSHWLIRANQGHSIKLDSAAVLQPVTLEAGNVPARVIHGTFFASWPAIVAAGGLKPMGRNHVHCSAGVPGEDEGVVSGMRRDAELVVEIDVEGSLREGGVKWWRSDNDVLLTEGDEQGLVSCRFFKLVTGRRIDVGVLWRDGEKVADLPAGLKVRPPPGKGHRGGRGGRNRGS